MNDNYCDLCSNPYPYMCSECNNFEETREVEIQLIDTKETEKLFIGSGEDVYVC